MRENCINFINLESSHLRIKNTKCNKMSIEELIEDRKKSILSKLSKFYEPLLVDALSTELKNLEYYLNSMIKVYIKDIKSREDIDPEIINSETIKNYYLLDYYHGLIDYLDVNIDIKLEKDLGLEMDYFFELQNEILAYKRQLSTKI